VVYDNQSFVHHFPIGIAYLASVLRKEHEVVIYNQDVHHYPEEHLTRYLDTNRFDAVGVGVVAGYYQYRKLLKISEAINRSKQRPHYILGGHGPSAEPEFFLKKTGADAVVVGEGETSVFWAIKKDGVFKSPLIKDVDSIPFPAYDIFPMQIYRLYREAHCTNTDFVMPMISGRGCPFKCTFCYRMDEGFRPRSAESIVEEIKFLQKDYGITYIAFNDELLMSSVKRTAELSEAFLPLNIKWFCNGRLNYADPELLKLMKRSGCTMINYGVEALDDEVLKKMNKHLAVEQIGKGVRATVDAGISPGLNVMWGNIGDTEQTLWEIVQFLEKYDDGMHRRTIRPVTPYPGSALYEKAVAEGKIKDCEDFYERKHLNSDLLTVNFTQMSDERCYDLLDWANSRLLSKYYGRQYNSAITDCYNLYKKKDVSFRGFRQ
jgi:anaerobic magnesium-protoporphyrin IX monomethyl ester cyclase